MLSYLVLSKKNNTPVKINVTDPHFAISCRPSYGPKFGCDIIINENSNANKESYCDLGYSFTRPDFKYRTDEARTFLAGSFLFKVIDIEVCSRKNSQV